VIVVVLSTRFLLFIVSSSLSLRPFFQASRKLDLAIARTLTAAAVILRH
jgi:hypothetical protein